MWQRTRTSQGYGVLTHNKIKWLAHRFACLIFKKCTKHKLNKSVVLHNCDYGHGGCVNPKHLQVGTQQQNVKDMIYRGRWKHWKEQ